MQLELPVAIDPTTIADKETKRKLVLRVDKTVKVLLDNCEVRENHNGRTNFDHIPEFAQSLLAYGQLTPIAGDLLADGRFIVTIGECRIRGMKYIREVLGMKNKFEYVLATVNPRNITEAQRSVMAIIENTHRKNYEPLEEAREYWKMLQMPNPLTGKPYNAAGIAVACGVSKMHVSNRLRLVNISEEEEEAIKDGTISPTALGGMIKQGLSEEERIDMINQSKESGEKIYVKDVIPAPKTDKPEKMFNGYDNSFVEAARIVVRHQQGSQSIIQRKMKVGYNTADLLINQLEKAGVIGEFMGSQPREVFIANDDELDALFVSIGIWTEEPGS